MSFWLIPFQLCRWILLWSCPFSEIHNYGRMNFDFWKKHQITQKKIHTWSFFFFFWIFVLWGDCNVTFSGCSHDTHCWPLTPLSSFPGRPIPPTSSSSLLPSAQLPSSHNPPPVSCQMPLLDSNTSHQIMDTNPDEEFSPNSYLLRACSGPQQASSSGKETVASEHVVVCVWWFGVSCEMTPLNQGWGEGGVGSEEVKCVCRLVTLRFQGLFVEGCGYWRGVAYLNRAWPSFSGKNFPPTVCESLQVSKVKCREMMEYWMLYYCDSGHSRRTPSTWPMHMHLRFFFFLMVGFWIFLPCLFRWFCNQNVFPWCECWMSCPVRSVLRVTSPLTLHLSHFTWN